MIAFLGCLLLVLGQPAQQDRKVVPAGELFKTASPSVVLIEIYGEDGKVSGSGSGFVVAAEPPRLRKLESHEGPDGKHPRDVKEKSGERSGPLRLSEQRAHGHHPCRFAGKCRQHGCF